VTLLRPGRTIAVTARSSSRLARLKVRYPSQRPARFSRYARRYPDQLPHPHYDAELALELLASTGELPDTRRGLVVLLTEYRHALHALATQARRPQAGPSPQNPPARP
jgi:hypothetical protein